MEEALQAGLSTPPPRVHIINDNEADIFRPVTPQTNELNVSGLAEGLRPSPDSDRPVCLFFGMHTEVGMLVAARLVREGYSIRTVASTVERRRELEKLDCVTAYYVPHFSQKTIELIGIGCEFCVHLSAIYSHHDPDHIFRNASRAQTYAIVRGARICGITRLLVHIPEAASLYQGGPLHSVDAPSVEELPTRPSGAAARILNEVERLVLDSNIETDDFVFETLIVRSRLLWGGADETSPKSIVLRHTIPGSPTTPDFIINGGCWGSSTCHVENFATGIICALARGRGGRAYNITDGHPVQCGLFIQELLRACTSSWSPNLPTSEQQAERARQGGTVLQPLSLKDAMEQGEAMERRGNLLGRWPTVSQAYVGMVGQNMILAHARTEEEIGYQPRISRTQGLQGIHDAKFPKQPTASSRPSVQVFGTNGRAETVTATKRGTNPSHKSND